MVIPCSFTLPAPHPLKGRKERVDVRLRFRGGGRFFPLRSTAFNSEDRDQVSRDFQGRTSLFGRITDGDCSVKMERISQDDSQVFEITLKRGDDLLWGRPRSFNLDVVGESLYCLFILFSLEIHISTKTTVMMEIFLSDRHPRGSCHQRHVVSHRGPAGHPELLRPLSLPLQTSCPAVELGERSSAEQH